MQGVLLCVLVSFSDRVILCSPGWPRNHYIAQADSELKAILLPQPPMTWDYKTELPYPARVLIYSGTILMPIHDLQIFSTVTFLSLMFLKAQEVFFSLGKGVWCYLSLVVAQGFGAMPKNSLPRQWSLDPMPLSFMGLGILRSLRHFHMLSWSVHVMWGMARLPALYVHPLCSGVSFLHWIVLATLKWSDFKCVGLLPGSFPLMGTSIPPWVLWRSRLL